MAMLIDISTAAKKQATSTRIRSQARERERDEREVIARRGREDYWCQRNPFEVNAGSTFNAVTSETARDGDRAARQRDGKMHALARLWGRARACGSMSFFHRKKERIAYWCVGLN